MALAGEGTPRDAKLGLRELDECMRGGKGGTIYTDQDVLHVPATACATLGETFLRGDGLPQSDKKAASALWTACALRDDAACGRLRTVCAARRKGDDDWTAMCEGN